MNARKNLQAKRRRQRRMRGWLRKRVGYKNWRQTPKKYAIQFFDATGGSAFIAPLPSDFQFPNRR